MISVQNLTKKYAGKTAVDDISFEVGKGEIVGFLGPNGAGKSTTMKILTSFLPATSGTATIAGFDVFSESLQARSRLGYLPENVPLYSDMRVDEYLKFRAGLKGVYGSQRKERVAEVKDLCSIGDVGRQMIGTLSKGYRQRVGLAETLLHSPELLILDEPTVGLDPNQIRQVRDLIRNLGKRHTILLSTHILSEVEMVCSRVLIINRGRIEASDSPENLLANLRSAGALTLEIRPGNDTAAATLLEVPGVRDVVEETMEEGWRCYRLRVEAAADVREAVHRVCVRNKWPLRELASSKATLEDVFVEYTQND